MTSRTPTDLTQDQLPALIDSFYTKVWADELIGPVFAHVDFKRHLPKMVDFWSTVLFSNGSYTGSPFDKHVPLSIDEQHFERWLALFNTTVDELFQGENAERIKARARVIGLTFQYKLQTLRAG